MVGYDYTIEFKPIKNKRERFGEVVFANGLRRVVIRVFDALYSDNNPEIISKINEVKLEEGKDYENIRVKSVEEYVLNSEKFKNSGLKEVDDIYDYGYEPLAEWACDIKEILLYLFKLIDEGDEKIRIYYFNRMRKIVNGTTHNEIFNLDN